MRIELGDTTRLGELRDFMHSVHAEATIEGEVVIV